MEIGESMRLRLKDNSPGVRWRFWLRNGFPFSKKFRIAHVVVGLSILCMSCPDFGPSEYPDQVVKEVQLQDWPYAVAVSADGGMIYIGCDSTLYGVNASNFRIDLKTRLDGPIYDLIASPRSDCVYAVSGWNRIYVVRSSDFVVTGTITTGHYHWAGTVLPSGEFLYVTACDSNTVLKIRTADNTIANEIRVAGSLYGICSSIDGSYVYVANESGKSVLVIRTSDDMPVAAVQLGDFPEELAMAPDGKHLYAVTPVMVLVVRTADNTVVDTIIGGLFSLDACVLPDSRYVYTTNVEGRDNLSISRTSDNKTVERLKVGGMLVDIAAHPGGEYVCCLDDGAMKLIVLGFAQ